MDMQALIIILVAFVNDMMMKMPWMGAALFYMGMFRLVFKPLCSMAMELVAYTPSPKDDLVVKGFMGSKVYKIVAYILDWSASIKLPKK